MDYLDDLPRIDGGWRYATLDRCHIDILRMLYTYRVVETDLGKPGEPPMSYGRFWDYESMTDVLVRLMEWDQGADTEPTYWIRSWDHRYWRPGVNQRGVDGELVP